MTIRQYPFGFLISDTPIQTSDLDHSSFERINIWDEYYLVKNHETQFEVVGDKELGVAWIGYATSVEHDELPASIVEEAYSHLQRGESAFHQLLDYVVGRWVALVAIQGKVRVYTDMLSLQPVYSHRNSCLISSHLPLLKKELEARQFAPGEFTKMGPYKLWDETEYENIGAIPPNFYLSLDNRDLTRFYPRKQHQLPETNLLEDIHSAVEMGRRSAKFWSSLPFKIHCALTAGMDTRLNAAVALSAGTKPTFVTYGSKRKPTTEDGPTLSSYKLDVSTATRITKDLGLEGIILPIEESQKYKISEAEKSILEENTIGSHALNFQGLYEHYVGQSPAICFVGTAFETFRDYYVSRTNALNYFQEFEKVLGGIAGFNEERRGRKLSTEEARDYWDRYDYQTVVDSGFNTGNQLFWEIRAARFQSEAISCQTTAFMPINPLAVRRIFEIGLGLPFEDRKSAAFSKLLIAIAFPPLAGYNINKSLFKHPELTQRIRPRILTRETANDNARVTPQNITGKIKFSTTELALGQEIFYEDVFGLDLGGIRITYRNNYNIGRPVSNIIHFVRVNGKDIGSFPVGKRNDPHTIVIDGLKDGDVVDFGLRSTRQNGRAWASVSQTELLEWDQTPLSSEEVLSISSSRNFRPAE